MPAMRDMRPTAPFAIVRGSLSVDRAIQVARTATWVLLRDHFTLLAPMFNE